MKEGKLIFTGAITINRLCGGGVIAVLSLVDYLRLNGLSFLPSNLDNFQDIDLSETCVGLILDLQVFNRTSF